MATTDRSFPSPFEVTIPSDCDGWQEMYAYHTVFSEDRRAFEDERFWFQNSLHGPEPFFPFDCVWYDAAITAFNQSCTRLFVLPPLSASRCGYSTGTSTKARTRSPTMRLSL